VKKVMNTSKGVLFLLEGLSLLFLLVVYRSYSVDHADPKGCEMVWMRPAYATLTKLDRTMTRMGDKYSMHLYREGGIDETELNPSGIPVVFIPGNAGSHKQGRSVASYCSKKTFDQQLDTKFDFYLAEFNEDLSAFHGRTMLDQAEYVNDAIRYILSLYGEDTKSVMVIGHSMGGIVARTLLALPNYVPNSINTIITLSTPHTIPPLTFDKDVNTVYDLVNQYWRRAFSLESDNDLSDMILVSITGGRSDSLVPSDYTSVLSVVPPSHGFTTFSSSIPKAWTGVDHQAIVWCSQCRRAVADALFDVVDSKGHVLPYNERLDQFKRHLLPGFPGEHEVDDVDDYKTGIFSSSVKLLLDSDHQTYHSSGGSLKVANLQNSPINVLPLIHGDFHGATVFTDSQDYKLYMCNRAKAGNEKELETHSYAADSASSDVFVCYDGTLDAVSLPVSNTSSVHPFINSQNGIHFWSYDNEQVSKFDFLVFVSGSQGFLSASNYDQHKIVIRESGSKVIVPSGYTDVSLESATSSLLSYNVKIQSSDPGENDKLFAPLLRQYIADPVESAFHVNVEKNSPVVSFHGPSPFVPYDPETANNLHLQLFTQPSDTTKYTVEVSVNIWASLANLALRYRVLGGTFPMCVTFLGMLFQLREYNKTGHFGRYQDSLYMVIRRLPIILTILTMAHFAISHESVRDFLRNIQIPSEQENMRALHAFNPQLKQNDIFLGLTQPYFWFLGPFFFVVAIGLCGVLLHLTQLLMCVIRLPVPKKIKPTDVSKPPSSIKRLTFIGVMCIAVSTFVPYQFAFIFAALMQLIHTSITPKLYTHRLGKSFYGFNEHISILFLLNAFINAPILIVWIHNLALHSTIHFATHHNVLSVLPCILLVENIYTGNMLPRMTRLQSVATVLLLSYYALYITLYGLLHAFMLHHLVNIFSLWLLVVYLDDPGTRHRIDTILTKKD
jgi:glycosylphosphatidylinositol deacylase